MATANYYYDYENENNLGRVVGEINSKSPKYILDLLEALENIHNLKLNLLNSRNISKNEKRVFKNKFDDVWEMIFTSMVEVVKNDFRRFARN